MSLFLNTIGTTYTQNFNTLSDIPGSTNFLSLNGWFLGESGGNADGQYAVDDGSSNVGDTYSYGAAGSTERALGSLQSGSLIPTLGVFFTNNTGRTITSIDVAYTGEEWRLGTAGRTDQLTVEYRIGGNEGDLSSGTWVSVPALNFTTPDTGGLAGARDGNTDRTALSATISGLSIPVGTTFAIRWTDVDASSNDDGLAVDDFSINTHSNVAPPVIQNDHANAVESTLLEVDAAHGVLANDSGATVVLSPALDGFQRTAGGGRIVFASDGSYQYISAAGFSGTDSVQYATDNGGIGTLFIDVAATALQPFVSVGDQVGVRHSVVTGFTQIGNGVATTLHNTPTVLSGGGYVVMIDDIQQAPGSGIELRTFDASNNLVSVFDPGFFLTSQKVTALPNGGYVFTYGTRTPIDPNDPFGGFTQTNYVQLFDAAGQSLSGPTPVGDVPGDIDTIAGVSVLPNGGFVVLQTSNVTGNPQLYAQSFSAAGVPESQQYAIGTTIQTKTPFILPDGEIVTATAAGDLDLQRYDTHGNPIGGQIVLPFDGHAIATYEFAVRPAGGFFVSWTTFVQNVGRRVEEITHVQAIDANGNPIGTETATDQIFTTLFGQPHGVVTPLANGGFVVTWRGVVDGNTVEKSQTYDPNGNAVGAPIEFDSQTAFGAERILAFALPDGGFAISVQTANAVNHDLFVYDNNGNPVGQLRMHDAGDGTDFSTIVLNNLPNGDTLVTAESFNSTTLGNDQITTQTVRFEGTTPVIQTGTSFYEDTTGTIPVMVSIPDPDGSEIVQWIDVAGIPAGWTLSDPGATAVFDGFIWKVIGGNVTHGGEIDLSLTPPANFSGTIAINVTAHTVDTGNGSVNQSFPAPFNVTILPTPDWTQSVDITPHPAGWQTAGIGDFNADGSSDLAWFNATTGNIDVWKLHNGQWAGSTNAGTHPAGYQPIAFGDFNHDGTSDVLWFNASTRDLDLWTISNAQWTGSIDIGAHPAGYAPVLTADFNGDGTSDVLWFNAATRDVDLWKIANGQWTGSVALGTHPAGYQPALAGDFTGDGTADVAWFNPTTGDVDIWKIANGQWTASIDAGQHPAGWQPLGAADFNNDGTSDIVWYNPATNSIDIWLIKNGQWADSVNIGAHPAGAVPVGVGDFDHNGVPDIMWRDTTTGHIDNWMLTLS